MTTPTQSSLNVVMIGATGAVGGHTADALASDQRIGRLTLLGRKLDADASGPNVRQHVVDLLEPESYREHLPGHDVAICTVGVGEPSKISREQFVRIDKDLVLDFARASKTAGVRQFQLLGSVGANSKARAFYLRTKGELEDALHSLAFERLSLFHPSMILTPNNRYGLSQAVILRVWPRLNPLLLGPLRAFRGVRVDVLGRSIAANCFVGELGDERLEFDDFERLSSHDHVA